MKRFKSLFEKKLTAAEKDKREEIAKAMERENPGMPMDKKMAIATAQAKKVAEGVELEEGLYHVEYGRSGRLTHQVIATNANDAHKKAMAHLKKKNPKLAHPDYADAFNKPSVTHIKGNEPRADKYKTESTELDEAQLDKMKKISPGFDDRKKAERHNDHLVSKKKASHKSYVAKIGDKYHVVDMKESAELDESIEKMPHGRLKWHMNTGVPHGSYTKGEMKAERDRRMKTGEGEAYKKAKPSLSEAAKPDAVEMMRKKKQMAAISTSDKDKLAKVRALLNKEKKK